MALNSYFALGFSLAVEVTNLRLAHKKAPADSS